MILGIFSFVISTVVLGLAYKYAEEHTQSNSDIYRIAMIVISVALVLNTVGFLVHNFKYIILVVLFALVFVQYRKRHK